MLQTEAFGLVQCFAGNCRNVGLPAVGYEIKGQIVDGIGGCAIQCGANVLFGCVDLVDRQILDLLVGQNHLAVHLGTVCNRLRTQRRNIGRKVLCLQSHFTDRLPTRLGAAQQPETFKR
ncbi:hypothetical protein LOM8899_01810 [Flavimaricola marinus]|uniref:Uncharacterized protein n=1 Tax=Flavimaricola marinus TaxID=1819565 RepID=A0A238LDI4_9RHOB|nr:hypothetical protein LOM8899_01810 [Flavimaricola marinus]